MSISKGIRKVILNVPNKWALGIRNSGGFICFLREPQRYSGQEKRYEAEIQTNKDDASLIAEAGTVHNETGLSPRQLLEQRDALLVSCKALMEYCDDGSASFDDPEPDGVFMKAIDAIAATE